MAILPSVFYCITLFLPFPSFLPHTKLTLTICCKAPKSGCIRWKKSKEKITVLYLTYIYFLDIQWNSFHNLFFVNILVLELFLFPTFCYPTLNLTQGQFKYYPCFKPSQTSSSNLFHLGNTRGFIVFPIYFLINYLGLQELP